MGGAGGAGTIGEGAEADLVLVDPLGEPLSSAERSVSVGRNTPLLGVDDLARCGGEPAVLRGVVRGAMVGGGTLVTSDGSGARLS